MEEPLEAAAFFRKKRKVLVGRNYPKISLASQIPVADRRATTFTFKCEVVSPEQNQEWGPSPLADSILPHPKMFLVHNA